MATVQLRNPTEGRAYFDRSKARGKTPNESMRLLKRRLSDIVYRTMVNDAARHITTGPGGQRGDVSDSNAAGSQLHTSTSDKPLPDPPPLTLRRRCQPRLDREGCPVRSSQWPRWGATRVVGEVGAAQGPAEVWSAPSPQFARLPSLLLHTRKRYRQVRGLSPPLPTLSAHAGVVLDQRAVEGVRRPPGASRN